jgi:hypothetical protein
MKYSGRNTWFDKLKHRWDLLGQLSPAPKCYIGGLVGGYYACDLISAAAALSPGSQPTLTRDQAIGLITGLGIARIWLSRGGLVHAALVYALGGTLGGVLAYGLPVLGGVLTHALSGAVVGACIGVGLGVGEWLGARYTSMASEPSETLEG